MFRPVITNKKKRILYEKGSTFSSTSDILPNINFYCLFSDLSLAVPVTNSLTFIFTMLSGHIFGEKIKSLGSINMEY